MFSRDVQFAPMPKVSERFEICNQLLHSEQCKALLENAQLPRLARQAFRTSTRFDSSAVAATLAINVTWPESKNTRRSREFQKTKNDSGEGCGWGQPASSSKKRKKKQEIVVTCV